MSKHNNDLFEKVTEEYGYEVDKYGIVRSKGFYECRHWSSVILWDWVLDSESTSTIIARDGNVYEIFQLTQKEKEALDIPQHIPYIALWVTDGDGLRTIWFDTKEDYYAWNNGLL